MSCGARAAPVHLSPKSFDLLQILIERRPALVTKTELQDRLWPDTVVLEANLGNAVAEIRKALGDDPEVAEVRLDGIAPRLPLLRRTSERGRRASRTAVASAGG